jgi:hypothetical protein
MAMPIPFIALALFAVVLVLGRDGIERVGILPGLLIFTIVVGLASFLSGVATPIPEFRIRDHQLDLKVFWCWRSLPNASIRCYRRNYGILLQSNKLPLIYLLFRWSPYDETKFMSVVIDRRISDYEKLCWELQYRGFLE